MKKKLLIAFLAQQEANLLYAIDTERPKPKDVKQALVRATWQNINRLLLDLRLSKK
jgi:hypothetical protein